MKFKLVPIVCLLFATDLVAQKDDLTRIPCSTDFSDIMLKKVDTTQSRGVADNYRIWENGQTLLVKFMPGGSQGLRNRVMQSAKQWEAHANVTFKFVTDDQTPTDIRIQLGKGRGHNSAIGKNANLYPQSMETINFDTLYFADAKYYVSRMKSRGVQPPYTWAKLEEEMYLDPGRWDDMELKRVVTHEFGHVLGLLHEQSFPGAIKWKKTDSVYNYYLTTQKWDKAKVDFNVFETSNIFYTNGTTYDALSIMHYIIEPWQTWDGYFVRNNYVISSGDKALVGNLYPKNKKTSDLLVPQVDIKNFTRLDVMNNTEKGGLSIFPAFDIKSNPKMGEVFFVARLLYEDNGKWYYVPTTTERYNWGGTVATYTDVTILPNSQVSYNKTVQNLELFLPNIYIPDLRGRNVKVEFAVILDDVANNQLNKLMYFLTTTSFSLTK